MRKSMSNLKDEILTLLFIIKRDISIATAKIKQMNESAIPAAIYLDKAHELVGHCQSDIEARGNDFISTIKLK